MSVLLLLVPLVLLLVLAAVVAYLWAARRGQFDDLDTPALRVLYDDEPASGAESRAASARTSPPAPEDFHG